MTPKPTTLEKSVTEDTRKYHKNISKNDYSVSMNTLERSWSLSDHLNRFIKGEQFSIPLTSGFRHPLKNL